MGRGAIVRLRAMLRGRAAVRDPSLGEGTMTDAWQTFTASWLWYLLLALTFGGGSVLAHLILGLLSPQLQRRTDRAKEKYADSLMSLSTAMLSAVFIGLFVVPVTAFIKALADQAFAGQMDLLSPLWTWFTSGRFTIRHAILFVVVFYVPLFIAARFRKWALNLYDDLAKKSWP
jgi:hypothetical protein